ncbi:MAG TPA: ester cyclase [Thermoleophilaceae bacterium]|nr:ester cyclase [Thermoleophilaceae bacterium]
MSEQNKAVARTFFEVFETGELDRLDDMVAADAVDHDPYNPHGDEGLEGMKKTVTMYREAFPDLSFTIDDQIAEGDKVVTRWTGRGTHQGELMGAPATGRTSTVIGIGIDRFEDGMIVEAWGCWDALGMFQQLGLTGEPAGARA